MLGDALNAGYRFLEVKCGACGLHSTLNLWTIRRPKEATPIHELERRLHDIGTSSPTLISVAVPPDALDGDVYSNVERQKRRLGGEALFGRLIRFADGLYLTAEFHCVVSTSTGLVDVSFSGKDETHTLFAPYPNLDTIEPGAVFFRPTIRARIYGIADHADELERKLSATTAADVASARKNGITVRQLMLSRLPRDQLGSRIDDYLRTEAKVETMLLSAHDGSRDWHPSELDGLKKELSRLDRERSELYAAADLHRGIGITGARPR